MRYIVLALLFVAVIGAAGFLALSQKREPHDPSPSPTTFANSALAETQGTTATQIPPQVITDEANLLTVTLPGDWTVLKEGPQGVRLSGIQAESPDFQILSDTQAEGPFTPMYYESGAHLQISIEQGGSARTQTPAGEILEEKTITVDDVKGMYFTFKEPSTAQGQLHSVQLVKDGNSYYFRFGYNPETFTQGTSLFQTIMSSVSFTH